MSHKATTWLSELPARDLGNSEFRVLFHLCDCHNPSAGCFPTQAYLRDRTGCSNGTVNNALSSLEQKGLILRHRSFDGVTHRQRPTRYILGFEMGEAQVPTPETGDGNARRNAPGRLQQVGDGADSKKRHEPTPKKSKSRLQPVGDKPVKEPVRNPRAQNGPAFFTADERAEAAQVVAHVEAGQRVRWPAVPERVRRCIVVQQLLPADVIEKLERGNEGGTTDGQ